MKTILLIGLLSITNIAVAKTCTMNCQNYGGGTYCTQQCLD